MPKADRDLDLLERKTPRLGVDFGIDHQTIGGGAPGLTLAFKARFESRDVAHHAGIAGLKKLEQERAMVPGRQWVGGFRRDIEPRKPFR